MHALTSSSGPRGSAGGAVGDAVGDALHSSHASLPDDCEVSVPEIEALMAPAREIDGVVGARFMGRGFGGAVLALVYDAALDEFTSHVRDGRAARAGRTATVRWARSVDGSGVHACPPERDRRQSSVAV